MEHKDSKKSLIIQKAAVFFYEYGYEKSTLRDIASACGIKHPSVYKHFKSKDALAQYFIKNYFQACNDNALLLSKELSAEEIYIYYWLNHFSVISHDSHFARFFYEYLKNCSSGFMQVESRNTLEVTKQLFSLDAFIDNLELNLELINSCGVKIGEYCMSGKIDEFQATEYIVKIMNALNNHRFQFSEDDISNFTVRHPDAKLYSGYDMSTNKFL